MCDNQIIYFQMKNRLLLLALFTLFSSVTVLAQSKFVIRGRVLSGDDKQPIMGANIIELDEAERFINGTITDFNGNFTFEVTSSNARIKVSFIGYKSQDLLVNNRPIINVTMQPDVEQLQEVAVVADVVSDDNPLRAIPRRNMTGASSRVDLTQMEEIGVSSADEALQGQIAGVDIVMNSGDPGSGSSIVIRGMGSLGASKPLIVVDGIPQDTKIDDDLDLASADAEDIGELVSISPTSIASIEVLKDAAETAPYGSKGADGVLLITTKRGTRGKPVFRYSYKYTGYTQPTEIPMLNGDEYVMLQLEELFAPEGNSLDIPEELAFDPTYKDYYNYSQNTDWLEEIRDQSPFAHDHNFEVSGGGDKTRYYSSVGYLDQDGTSLNTNLKRLSTLIKLTYNVSSNLRFDAKFDFTNTDRSYTPDIEYKKDKYRSVKAMAYMKAPNMSIYEYDSNGNSTGEFFNPIESYQGDGYTFFNPVALATLSEGKIAQNQIAPTFTVTYNVNNHLRYSGTVSYKFISEKSSKFIPYSAIGASWVDEKNNNSFENDLSAAQLYSRNQLVYNNVFAGKHTMVLSATWETSQVDNTKFGSEVTLTPSTSFKDPSSNSVLQGLSSSYDQGRDMGGLISGNYVFDDRYIFNGSLRFDGNSQFGDAKRWGKFPALSAGWRMSNENFMKGLSFVEDFKWRLSYGVSGKAPGTAYGRFAIYDAPSTSAYIYNSIIVPKNIQLTQLRWQKVSQVNFGADMSLLEKGKLFVKFDIYHKVTTDLVHKNYKIPSTSGFANFARYNGGELQNKGYDIEMNYRIINSKIWKFSVGANTAKNINSYESLPDNYVLVKDSEMSNGKYPRKAVLGEPIGSFYGVKYLGVYSRTSDIQALDDNGKQLYDLAGKPIELSYQTGGNTGRFEQGDAIYEDINNDGRIDNYDVTYIGDSSPDFMGGFNTSLSYKNLRLSLGFYGRLGQDIVNRTAINTQNMSGSENQSKAVLHRWRKPGDGENYLVLPRAYKGHRVNYLGSDRFIEDGSYVRLNNVSLKYDVPKEYCSRIGLKTVSVALNLRKLYTWTNYSGQDPEVKIGSDPFWMGEDDARTPPSRQITFNLNVSF